MSFDDKEDGLLTRNPDWVAYEMRAKPAAMPSGKEPSRPSTWIEDDKYKDEAPHDKSYKHSGFHRGYLCMKYIAWRLGANADWNTHTTINASPQHAKFNTGVWLNMEEKTKDWADEYELTIVLFLACLRRAYPYFLLVSDELILDFLLVERSLYILPNIYRN